MHAFLIVGQSTPEREKEIEKVLGSRRVVHSPLHRFILSPRQLQEKETYGIEDIRSLTRWTSQLHEQPCAVLIEESQRLTEPAQHALLKTLEEGAPNMTIVLSAQSEQSLLPTIRSRCRVIRVVGGEGELSREKSQKIVAWITKVSDQEPAKRILMLYQALSKIAKKTVSPHVGSIQRQDGIQFLKRIIGALHSSVQDSALSASLTRQSLFLRFAVIAHRQLQQNGNVALALQQFVLDIPSR
jgi:hypothetical protein